MVRGVRANSLRNQERAVMGSLLPEEVRVRCAGRAPSRTCRPRLGWLLCSAHTHPIMASLDCQDFCLFFEPAIGCGAMAEQRSEKAEQQIQPAAELLPVVYVEL